MFINNFTLFTHNLLNLMKLPVNNFNEVEVLSVINKIKFSKAVGPD